MPRLARKDLESTFFHIMVQGIEKRYIFDKEIYKKKYLKLIIETGEKYGIRVLSYCIMDNHCHILINIDRIEDMSKFMHKINFSFAQFYNYMENKRVGYVFRDRFSSEQIFNEEYLFNCIVYIHNNPVKAKMVKSPKDYKYSSYNDYKNKRGIYNKDILKEIIDLSRIADEKNESEYTFQDIENNNEEVIDCIILKYEKKYNMKISEMRKEKDIIRNIIYELKNNYKIKYKEMSPKIKLSLSTISRLVNEK